jgi:hypothetical protein
LEGEEEGGDSVDEDREPLTPAPNGVFVAEGDPPLSKESWGESVFVKDPVGGSGAPRSVFCSMD